MVRLNARLTLALALPSLLLGATSAYAAAMELKDVLQYALQHAPKLAQAQEQIHQRGWAEDQVRAQFLPSVDVTTSQGLMKTENPPWAGQRDPYVTTATPPTSSPLFSTLNFGVTETFYDNGQSQTQLEISRSDRDVAALSAQQTRDDALLAAIKSYYALCQAKILLETSRQQYQLLDKQLRLLDTMYHQGLKTAREFQRLESQVQRAAVDVRSSETTVRGAETDLRRTIGAPPQDASLTFAPVPAETALSQKISFPTAVPSADTSYDARIAKLDDESAGRRVELARRKNLPQLTVSSGVAYQNPDYMGFQGRPQAQDTFAWNVTLGLTYNLWDAGSRRHAIDIAASQQLVHNQDTKDKLDSITADIERLMQSLSNLKDTLQLNLRLISLEQENLKNLEQDFREGKVQYLDLVTGINDLLSAKVNFFTTYFATLQAIAQYHYYEGTIVNAVADF